MSLIQKLFGRQARATPPAPGPGEFQESETTTAEVTRNAPRRELVQVVLRDTMRLHGVPAGLIECRILSVVSRSAVAGMHVQLVIRDGQEQMLAFVPAFQASFKNELEKFEPNAHKWLLSLSWQFDGFSGKHPGMPNSSVWLAVAAHAASTASTARTASMAAATPGGHEEDDVMKDVEALFAIRDAAMREQASPGGHVDFQPTQPGGDGSPGPKA